MVSRLLSRPRMCLLALTVLFLIGDLTPPGALAWMQIERSDRTEGDPGDGVLDPAVAGPVSRPKDQEPDVIVAVSSVRRQDVRPLPLGNLFLVSWQLPGGLPGPGPVIFLSRTWWRDHASVPWHEGRWHDAP